MAILLAYPNETLFNILSCLNMEDLLSVSRVSRRLHSLSLPLIYEAPILHAMSWSHVTGIPCLILTLMAKPAIANYVKSVEVELESWQSEPPSPSDIQSRASVESLHHYDVRRQGMHLVRLLRMLPRLAHLCFWLPENSAFSSRMTHLHAAIDNHTMLPVGLRNLREFRSVSNLGFTPELLISVMSLPSIRTIAVIVRTNPGDFDDIELGRIRSIIDLANTAAGSSTVTELQLLSSDLSERVLAALLAIPRALTRFRYVSSIPQTDFDLAGFGKILLSLAPSLQYLSVAFGTTVPLDEDAWPGRIGELGDCNALKTLECPMMALLGRRPLTELSLVGVLPRGLQSLRVTEDIFWSTERAVGLLAGLLETGWMGSLGEIRLIFSEDVELPETVLAKLRSACVKAHVAFVTQREVLIDSRGFQSL